MKITFIRPNMFARRSADAMQPLSFAYLQRCTPPDFATELFDERIEPVPLDRDTDLVAMTVETYTARRAYQIARHYRRRGVPVVLGGYHPTLALEESLQYADAVVCGDAENQWGQLLQDLPAGHLRRVYQAQQAPDLAGLQPDRSIFAGKRYAPIGLVQYGRGCRYHCDFCSIRAFYQSHLRQRPVGEVVDEIRSLGHRHIFLVDDNLFVDIPRARELFTALAPLRIRWSCQISIDVARDADLVQLMRRSGCLTAVIGFESLDPQNLTQMRKGWNLTHGGYSTALSVLRDAGIMVYGTFVFGYDQDSVESFDQAVDFAIANRFYLANFNPLTPTPGTTLYQRLSSEGRLIYDRWWLDARFRYGQATFHPRKMTAQELTDGCFRARTRFNTWRSLARRAVAPRTNLRSPYRLGLFLLSNLVSRREIRAKQGMPLGVPEESLGELPAAPDNTLVTVPAAAGKEGAK